MKKIITLILIFLNMFCFGQQTYYREHVTKKIYNENEYENLKKEKTALFEKNYLSYFTKQNPQGCEMIITKNLIKQDKDSIIYDSGFLVLQKQLIEMLNQDNKIVGQKFPFEKLKTINGHKITLEDLQNKPTMVHFWFTKCAPCVTEIKYLNKVASEYAGKVNFIAITFDSKNTVKDFLVEKNINFIHVVDEQRIIDKLDINSFPKNVFVDRNGIINSVYNPIYNMIEVDKNLQYETSDEFAAILEKLLK
jgi:cytochrome c biogenesis protein CcmG, thiol:disulfide interchange protein DsbE